MWWISIILMIIAGMFNATMDVLKTRYNKSIFNNLKWKWEKWVNPAVSHPNKWKNGNIEEGPRFFGSSTFLVWVTDLWHLSKMLMLLAIVFAMTFYQPIVAWYADWFILYCSFTIPFEIFYSKVLIKS